LRIYFVILLLIKADCKDKESLWENGAKSLRSTWKKLRNAKWLDFWMNIILIIIGQA